MRGDQIASWVEQWSRTQRWLVRFGETTAGRVHDRESDYYQDEAYAFFQNCYHLKDWLKNDPYAQPLVGDVEAFINGSLNLSICADLCNGSKHLTLTTPRASADTRIASRKFSLELQTTAIGSGEDAPPRIAVVYVLESGGETHSAYEVATACVDEWSSYLRAKDLI